MKIAFKDVLALVVTIIVWGSIGALFVMGNPVPLELWGTGSGILAYVFGRSQEGNLPEVQIGKTKE